MGVQQAFKKGMRSSRRHFVLSISGLLASSAAFVPRRAASADSDMVTIVTFTNEGARGAVTTLPKIVKTDTQWRAQLSNLAFLVARKAGTEVPFTGAYWNLHDIGIYRCVCCDTALFNSDTKFESGTGWPSFWQPIAKENIRESDDRTLGMERTAVACTRCDAHLGHVFNDGPRPTGLRYCMNSVSLRFAKRA